MKYLFLKFAVTVPAFFVFILIVVGITESGGSALWTLGLGIPFVICLCCFYRYADKSETDERKTKRAPSSPETALSSYPEPYCVSRFIWVNVLCFSRQCGVNFTLDELTYLWTFFFYVVVKEFRDQTFIDSIYSYFINPLFHLAKNLPPKSQAVPEMKRAYRQLRPILNGSKIDPRTPAGMDALWYFVLQWVFQNRTCPVDAKTNFYGAVRLISKFCSKRYDSKSKSITSATRERYSVCDDEETSFLPSEETT